MPDEPAQEPQNIPPEEANPLAVLAKYINRARSVKLRQQGRGRRAQIDTRGEMSAEEAKAFSDVLAYGISRLGATKQDGTPYEEKDMVGMLDGSKLTKQGAEAIKDLQIALNKKYDEYFKESPEKAAAAFPYGKLTEDGMLGKKTFGSINGVMKLEQEADAAKKAETAPKPAADAPATAPVVAEAPKAEGEKLPYTPMEPPAEIDISKATQPKQRYSTIPASFGESKPEAAPSAAPAAKP